MDRAALVSFMDVDLTYCTPLLLLKLKEHTDKFLKQGLDCVLYPRVYRESPLTLR